MINPQSRIITQEFNEEDKIDSSIRPQSLNDFIGQTALKENLKVFIETTKQRGEPLDHVLFYGPPGLGKTTLSMIIAKELGVDFKQTSGPVLSKTGDLAAILTNLKQNDILFIDEVHRLNIAVEEILYSAMEDFHIDVIIGEGVSARTVKINLPKFTLIAATTRLGLLTNPLRDRFGIPLKLDFYNQNELKQVVLRGAKLLNVTIDEEGANELAKCSRGTPRIALRLLKRIRDYSEYQGVKLVDLDLVKSSLIKLGVDELGLDMFDHKYLRYIAENYNGGPVGIETIAAGLSEDRDTIEDTIEPYLMQIGFINRTPRGRILTQAAINHLI